MQFHLLFLAAASLVAAQGPVKPCTTTVKTHATCCGPRFQHTSTSLIDCHGCGVVQTMTTGPVCDLKCPTPTPTTSGTTTVVSCKPTPKALVRDEAQADKHCTSTTTEFGGCNGCTKAAHTATKSVDCHGCDKLATSFRVRCDPVCTKVTTLPASTTTVAVCKITPA